MFSSTMREDFAALSNAAAATIDAAKAQNRDLTDDETQANEHRFAKMRMIESQQDAGHQFMLSKIDAAAAGQHVPGLQFPASAPGQQQYDANLARSGLFPAHQFSGGGMLSTDAQFAQAVQEHRHAVNNFIRTGHEPVGLKFTLTSGTGSGVLVPPVVGRPIVLKRVTNPFRAALMTRGLIVMVTSDMSVVNVPIFDDSANTADAIAENATGDNPKDPATTTLALGAPLLDSGTVWFSNTLLGSINYDLLAYLEPMLEARISAKELAVWSAAVLATVVTGKTTASTTGVTYAELLDWQHSIPVEQRADGVFVLNDSLFRAIRGLVDSTGHPIYQESLRDDAPDRLLGWPVIPTSALQAPGAGNVSGLAVSAQSIVIRDVSGPNGGRRIARYAMQPAWPDQTGIRMFSNSGFNFIPSGVRALKHAAS